MFPFRQAVVRTIYGGLVILVLTGGLVGAHRVLRPTTPALEGMWYVANETESISAFVERAGDVGIVSPQSFRVGADGEVRGDVEPRVLAAARARGVRVMPLAYPPAFDRDTVAQFLGDPAALRRAADELAQLCVGTGLWGIQLDFEHVHISDRDRLTAFVREAATALKRVGCRLGVAVVPRTSDIPGPTPFHQWMHEFWRGAYDLAALADVADLVILMAYDQHTRYTPPGPVAALPWTEAAVAHALAAGVPPGKLMLGVPAYSRVWTAVPSAEDIGTVSGPGLDVRGLSHTEARALLGARGAAARWDSRTRSAYAVWENAGVQEHLSMEDARSFDERVALARKRGLRGVAVWRLGHEDPEVWTRIGRSVRGAR